MTTQILMPALSPTTFTVMARLVRAIHPARVYAPKRKLDGPHSRAMTVWGLR